MAELQFKNDKLTQKLAKTKMFYSKQNKQYKKLQKIQEKYESLKNKSQKYRIMLL